MAAIERHCAEAGNIEKSAGLAMAKAVWNGQTLAESDTYETVEGNIYFPDESVKREWKPSSWLGEFLTCIMTVLWPNKSPEPTAVGAVSSVIAVHATSRRWLSFLR